MGIQTQQKPTPIFLFSTILIAVVVLTFLIAHPHSPTTCYGTGVFTNPELNCIESDEIETSSIIEQKVSSYIQEVHSKKTANKVSVFYRDLTTKKWFGIDEQTSFAPGSLLKIPIAITYFKYAEIDPTILNQITVYKTTNKSEAFQRYTPPTPLIVGNTYSVKDLIKHMVSYSSNEAVEVLYSGLNKDFYNQVLTDLDITIPTTGTEQRVVSVKTYAAMMRALYNASYLNRENSEELLTMMSQSSFTRGLRAGIPHEVKLANKFGERGTYDNKTGAITSEQLHDCGIVYKTDKHYILCVMTEGPAPIENLEKVIADISKIVYENR